MSKKVPIMATQKPLTFSVEKLGSVQSGKFTQKPLTIFCGPNNSGKTWTMYALRSFYNLAESVYEFQKSTISQILDHDSAAVEPEDLEAVYKHISAPIFKKELNNGLADYFHSSNELFQDTKFGCDFKGEEWLQWIMNYPKPNVFLMPAERNGVQLLYRELSSRRTALLHHASKKDININELLRNVMGARYARPIADYIDWLNILSTQRGKSETFHHEALFIQKQLVQGRYHLDRQTNALTYTPYVKKQGMSSHKLGLHVASSAVKSLFGLWFYLEYQSKAGDILMIDEPELNLHPKNQLLITHLLARLVNADIQVVISTHSDYIVREFNNLILLSEDGRGRLIKELNKRRGSIKYEKEATLKREKVEMYSFDEHTIKPFTFTRGEGFAISTFDKVIISQNEINNEIYHGLKYEGVDK